MATPIAGGITEVPAGNENDLTTVELARFALDEHKKKSNEVLEFVRVVKVKKQVVSGTMHHLTIEASDETKTMKLYEAKVWEKPWMNFKELSEMKHLGDSTSS
ncbi:hypothetical protein LUZ60_011163 [Juncus effusus]|nr:hypothetical protein LUZ60_011163 [Juncus effusus]